MKALVLHEFGEPNQFRLEEIEQPTPQKGQVLINIKAIGVNPLDTKVRKGSNRIAKNMHMPAVIGWDVSGVITHCGEEVTAFAAGDEVFGCIGFPGAGGAYAEYAVADTKAITKKPASVSFEEAAALPIVGVTAYQAINEHLQVQKGQTVLIQAAAGGVGHLALQFAKLNGAYVYGTASERNRDFLTSLGIDKMINYHKEKFEDYVKDVDLVLDAMGGDVLYRSIKCTKPGGKVVCLPSSTKNDPKAIKLAKERNVNLEWIIMYVSSAHLQEMAVLISEGKLKINIDQIIPFTDMAKAHESIESQSTRGKIVVQL